MAVRSRDFAKVTSCAKQSSGIATFAAAANGSKLPHFSYAGCLRKGPLLPKRGIRRHVRFGLEAAKSTCSIQARRRWQLRAPGRLAALQQQGRSEFAPDPSGHMTPASPNETFELGAAGTLPQRQKISQDFPEADISGFTICHADAAPRSTVSEAQIATFANSGRSGALANPISP